MESPRGAHTCSYSCTSHVHHVCHTVSSRSPEYAALKEERSQALWAAVERVGGAGLAYGLEQDMLSNTVCLMSGPVTIFLYSKWSQCRVSRAAVERVSGAALCYV